MSFVFQLPDVGEGIHEAEIVEILVAVGDSVKEDQEILKIETDKALVSLPAPVSGKVLEIPVEIGDTVEVGDPLVTFAAEENDDKEAEAALAQTPAGDVHSSSNVPARGSAAKSPSVQKRVPATPHTRQYARKMGVDINKIKGSGRNGRITDEDVDRAAAAPPIELPVREKSTFGDLASEEVTSQLDEFGPTRRAPFKGIRKKTAEAMSRSASTIPHVWHAEDVDVTDLFEVVKQQRQMAEEQSIRLTSLAFVVRAVVSALKNFPHVNSQLDEVSSEIVLKEYCHIGIATDTDHGLIVPVIRDADKMSILKIAGEIQSLAEKARTREIDLEQLKGAGFTITNVGVIGGVHATPMIQPPQVAILALMAARKRPVVLDDQIQIRRIMPLVLAFDHRVLDGAMMARFMNHIKSLLENPMRMLVELI